MTDHGKLGSILENESDFVHTLQRIIDTDMYSPELYSDITSYAREHFAWEDNLKKLSHLLFGDNDEDRKEK